MLNTGKLLKTLRTERNFTQDKLAKDITTRTTIASIENRNSTVSFELLIQLLNRLNVRVEEFLFLLGESPQNKKQLLYSNVYSDYYTKGFLSEKIENELLSEYEHSQDFFYVAIYIQMLGIEFRTKGKLSKEKENQLNKYVNLLKQHLNNVENWNHMELAIFTNCLFLFESDYIQATYKRALKKMTTMKQLRLYQEDITVFLLNSVNLFLERNLDALADYFLKELTNQISRDNQLYERTLSQFYQAILDNRKGDEEAVERIERIINYLKFLGENKKANDLIEDIKNYTDLEGNFL